MVAAGGSTSHIGKKLDVENGVDGEGGHGGLHKIRGE